VSAALNSLLGPDRLADIERGATQPRTLFLVNIGPRENPRFSFSVLARSSAEAIEDSLCLAKEGERVTAIPAGGRRPALPSFEIKAARQALECAELRDSPAAVRAREFHRKNDAAALDLQVQFSGFIGGLPR
jgi:hypothetical protein